MASISNLTPGEGLGNKDLEGTSVKGSAFFCDFKKREGYAIRYYCQSEENIPALYPLNDNERNQLDEIVVKLLNNGVKLGISFTLVSDILVQSNEAK